MELKEVIELWKELNISTANFNFHCGGDSMNDTDLTFTDTNGNSVENSELHSYFEDEVYNKVEFYEASDGHYQGESGTVVIELNDEVDDFTYSKSSESEWCEALDSKTNIELTDKETEFLKNHVANINGGDGDVAVVFKNDLILQDADEELLKLLEEKISEFTNDYEPNELEGELDEWFTFSTEEEEGEGDIELKENNLTIYMRNSETVYKDE